MAHADLGGSIPGFVRKILVKAQPAVCLKVQEFFNDPTLRDTVVRTSFKQHPDLPLRPRLFAKGSLEQMLANRAVLDKQDAEEIAEAAAQAAASRAAAELEAQETESLVENNTPRGAEEGKLDETSTNDSVLHLESQGEETAASSTVAIESGPSALQSAADTLDSLLDEFFSAVADDISASTSSDATSEGNGASARKKKRRGVVVFEIASCGQWVLDLAAGVVQRHPAGTAPSVAGFDPKKNCLSITCKEKVCHNLIVIACSFFRVIANAIPL